MWSDTNIGTGQVRLRVVRGFNQTYSPVRVRAHKFTVDKGTAG